MIPLERYMASLMPLQKDISAFRAAPTPNHFKQDCFLATLELSGPQLTSPLKGDWSGLYKRFFRSPNFQDWYTEDLKITITLHVYTYFFFLFFCDYPLGMNYGTVSLHRHCNIYKCKRYQTRYDY